jgi:glutamyl-tRNA(Gln) amidotransferase subunit E
VTYQDMTTPRDVAGVAEVIRRLNRATGKVRTGAGAARQDVNVSIRGGRRCEIKGVPSIRQIPRLVHNEAFRQLALLEIRDELLRRGVSEGTFYSKDVDITDKMLRTRFWPILQAVREGRKVRAVLLRGFDGLLRHSIGPGKNFLQEFSDRVRVVACIDLLPNVLSSDLPEGNLSPEDWQSVRRAAGALQGDAVIVVWGVEEDVRTACEEVALRAREACTGVPRETRQAMPDGTTGFERVLPGPGRMYPDTDLPPKALPDGRVDRIRARLPETPWSREGRYRAAGVPEQLAHRLSISPRARLFDLLDRAADGSAVLAASLLTDHVRRFQRKGIEVNHVDESFLVKAFELLRGGRLVPDGVVQIFAHRLRTGRGTVDELVEKLGLAPATPEEIGRVIDTFVAQVNLRQFASREAAWRFVMGRIMASLRGRARGGEVARLLDQRVGWGGLA